MSRFALLPCVALSLLLAAPAGAAVPGYNALPTGYHHPHHPVPGQRVNDQDRQFVQQAERDTRLQIALGNDARQNAQSKQVKQYGEWMVRENTAAAQSLQAVAAKAGIAPPAADAQQAQEHDRLATLRGSMFDSAYMTRMVQNNDNVIRAFRQEIRDGSDPGVKRFAQDMLTKLARRDQLAQQIRESLTAFGSSAPPR